MHRLVAGAIVCASIVPLVSGCTKRSERNQPTVIPVNAAPVGKETGATVRSAILGAGASGPAGAAITKQMDKQAQELAFELPGGMVQRLGGGIVITLPESMLFAQESNELSTASRDNLRRLATSFEKYPNTRVMIVGHTDAQGGTDRNLDLSQRRAQALTDFLEQVGINRARMTAIGRGDAEPIATNDTDAGRQWNRRIEIAIYADEATRFGTSQ
ncbi:MAG TPA: OmpA family protein [Gemmatimonadales bacterium]|jgi:outer membrane protein OmpA-like peptidoglycan-associated protein|nr:OmpA family protein [Gemmatimonadales bacterium]